MARLIVLGAGPAGLGAALRAAQARHEVVVLEREAAVGGLTASFEVAGVRVDHGSHRLHPTTPPPVLEVLAGLLGPELQRRERKGRIRLGGRWIGWPAAPRDLLRLPPPLLAGVAWDTATGWSRRGAPGDTFAEIARAAVGPRLATAFYAPYARKIWGLEPGELDGEQARRRIGVRSPTGLLRRVVGDVRAPGAGTFLYPAGGFGRIAEVLADAATAAGADLRCGVTATRVDLRPDGVEVRHRPTPPASPGGRDTVGGALTPAEDAGVEAAAAILGADALLSTVPLGVLARLAAPPDVVAAAAGLRSRAMVLVYLALACDRFTPFDAHYLPEAATPVTRVSEPKGYRDSPADPPDVTVLCAELPCTLGDATWSATDEDLVALVCEGLAASHLPDLRPVEGDVRRVPSAYPVYHRGWAAPFAAVDAWADAEPRLLTFGRQGLFAHDNTHHALAMAWDAVAALRPDGAVDRAAWAAARHRFTTHVVED